LKTGEEANCVDNPMPGNNSRETARVLEGLVKQAYRGALTNPRSLAMNITARHPLLEKQVEGYYGQMVAEIDRKVSGYESIDAWNSLAPSDFYAAALLSQVSKVRAIRDFSASGTSSNYAKDLLTYALVDYAADRIAAKALLQAAALPREENKKVGELAQVV